MEFFDNLEPLLRSFWYIALPASAIFLIQSVMTFAGADSHGDVSDTDTVTHEGDFQLFSVRNMINFLLGVSWTGISCYDYISNPFVLIALSVVVGSVFVYFFFLISGLDFF